MASVKTSSRWDWLEVLVDGDDLVVRNTRATNFGHAQDKEDNGVGCAGFPVAKHPELALVALPFAVQGHAQFHDSPIPHLPAKSPRIPGQQVRVWCPQTSTAVMCELADLGPSLYIGKAPFRRFLKTGIDLSEGAVKGLGLTLRQGEYKVDYRIIGGKAFVPKEMLP